MEQAERIQSIKAEFSANSKILIALSDETRQRILLELMGNRESNGIQVKDLAKKINLSRPAVSHHLKVLKDEGIISINQDGTKNFYYISGCSEILKIKKQIGRAHV